MKIQLERERALMAAGSGEGAVAGDSGSNARRLNLDEAAIDPAVNWS